MTGLNDSSTPVHGVRRVWTGEPHPLGATHDGEGTNFALFSSVAEGVELCLLDGDDRHETRIELTEVDGHIWHAYLPDIGPGQRYGYRVHGPWEPARGRRCNPSKLLLDPYARSVDGTVDWSPACYAHDPDDPDRLNTHDSAPHVPLGVVTGGQFDWGDDRPPQVPMHRSVIYETHVRGMTLQHPAVPEPLRGTYAGIAHPAVIDHLTSLGITAVELMPVHQFAHDHHLVERGLRNYWGYNTLAYLSPHSRYTEEGENPMDSFRSMVRALHSAGIEVILDVVYNHTAEGNHLGPTFSFRGIDNEAYYRLVDEDPRHYLDFTGCGNTLNMRHP
ncbi:MAG: alpha-amylase family glycosyl hydrolase, partial [Ilumatobacteraceae bacterium]